MKKSEAQILADVYEKVRGLTKFYFGALKDIDIYLCPEINNVKLNSPYWIAAHLVWTEHFLLVKGVGGENMNIEWLEEYSYGSNPDKVKTKPDFNVVLKTLDEVHKKAIEIIESLSDEQLDGENYIDVDFGNSKSKRTVITHAIRHEPMHIGQISWILKSNGLKFT